MTRVYGVLGDPIAHSRSPAIHRAAFEAAGIDAVYGRFHVRAEQLEAAIHGARALGICGLNVTLPHKESVMPLLDEVEDDARLIGAVNTIARQGERLIGLNTDAPGLVASLVEAGAQTRGSRVVILGAGGAARAAAVGLARAGAASVRVLARRPQAASALATQLASALSFPMTSDALDVADAFDDASLIVQASSATLDPAAGEALAAALPWERARDAAVVDLVYQPPRTAVLRAAERAGLHTIEGGGMLLHQAALAWTRWTGKQAPLAAMRKALERT